MLNVEVLLYVLLAYLTGSIPFAVWLGRIFYKIDVRKFGSGNAGATNVFRVIGWRIGCIVLLLDVAKGWFSVYYLNFISDTYFVSKFQFELQLALGIAAVIGHILPIYIGFNGGKGIATLLGLLFAINFPAASFAILIFFIIFIIFRYVSLASIFASFSFPVFIYFFTGYDNYSLMIFAFFVPVLSLITHRKNIVRLLTRQETKVNFGKK